MTKAFWQQCWENNHIGFHRDEVNANLIKFFPELNPAQVLVPLCGKTHDMQWLMQKSERVIGVDISPIAITDFFAEHQLTAEKQEQEKFSLYTADNLQLYCGDFFDLEAEHIKPTNIVYDRGALIALPKSLRQTYVTHLTGILPNGCQILLITYDYTNGETFGPPFAISSSEFDDLYAEHYTHRILENELIEFKTLAGETLTGFRRIYLLKKKE